jgi:hypothetical protein
MFEKVAPDTSWFNRVRKRPSKGELFLGTGKYIFNITEPMRIETGIG